MNPNSSVSVLQSKCSSPNFALHANHGKLDLVLVKPFLLRCDQINLLAPQFALATGPTDNTEPFPLEQRTNGMLETATFRGGVHWAPNPIGGIESDWISSNDGIEHSQTALVKNNRACGAHRPETRDLTSHSLRRLFKARLDVLRMPEMARSSRRRRSPRSGGGRSPKAPLVCTRSQGKLHQRITIRFVQVIRKRDHP